MRTITVVEVNDVSLFPPVQSLLKVLLSNGYNVKLIGTNLKNIPDDITDSPNYVGYEIPARGSMSLFGKIKYRLKLHRFVNSCVDKCMRDSDCLWTTSMDSMRELGKHALKYKNVLQMMELVRYGYTFRQYIRFPIGKYARLSWKTVVPEINRAYIQQVWWDLPKVPHVLPNKPYSIDYGAVTPEMETAMQRMKNEKKKIVLYLGCIGPDREFTSVVNAIKKMEDYILYVVGRSFTPEGDQMLQKLKENNAVVYLGGFTSPKHLALVQYAYIGLLTYKPQKGYNSELNALYCAPNKIFEYAGFGVPMVGSDVLGLRLPFEKWNIGCCCDFNDTDSIIRAIEMVDLQHDEMSKNCAPFFNSVDLHKIIVEDILEDA